MKPIFGKKKPKIKKPLMPKHNEVVITSSLVWLGLD
jgi:hypothetical protein